MATAEAALRALLLSGSPIGPVAALVGTRVYPRVLPENVRYPAIRYIRISTPRSPYRDLSGIANYARPRFQIDCWATTESECLALAQAVRVTLEGFNGTSAGLRLDGVAIEDEAAELEPEAGEGGIHLYRQRLDFFLPHAE